MRDRMHDDQGFAAGGEALAFGVLIFVVGTLMVLSAWRVVDAKFATAAASREATRSFAEAVTPRAGAVAAQAAARQALQGHGLELSGLQGVVVSGSLDRCQRVHAVTTYVVPGIRLPWVGGLGAVTVRSDHTEIVDPLRGGLDGEASCVS